MFDRPEQASSPALIKIQFCLFCHLRAPDILHSHKGLIFVDFPPPVLHFCDVLSVSGFVTLEKTLTTTCSYQALSRLLCYCFIYVSKVSFYSVSVFNV